MHKPNRHRNHVLENKSKKFFERQLPDEWICNNVDNDYGIDVSVEIVVNSHVTGLNFSVQLKSTEQVDDSEYARVILKRSTLNYYKVRLEPTMLVMYDATDNQAYWAWISDFDIDYSKPNQTDTLAIPKSSLLSEVNWDSIVDYVQHIFHAKSIVDEFDIRQIENDIELGAWRSYYEADYAQAIFLFRKLLQEGNRKFSVHQALVWSLYQTFQYKDALTYINQLLQIEEDDHLLIIKACILTEYGQQEGDKGKLIQARNIFQRFLQKIDNSDMHFNYGNALYGLENYSEALEQYKLGVAKEPMNALCWKNMGTTYYHLGQHQEELECYDRALAINPDLPQALFSKGVTLAQYFNEYQTALDLFNRVFELENDLVHMYVNGFFWVAHCHEQLGNLNSALFWVDRGLEYAGKNIYFLNQKANLLGKHWKTHPELKEKAIEFFQYRIELEKDYLSMYYLIDIYGYDLDNTIFFLKDKCILYKDLSVEQLQSLEITLDGIKETLIYMPYYAEFRRSYPTGRYVDNLINPYFLITIDFWRLLDVVCCLAFGRGIKAAKNEEDVLVHGKIIYLTMINKMPLLVDHLLPPENFGKETIAELLVINRQGFIDVVHREIGIQSGHITAKLGLRTVDPDEYFTDEMEEELYENVLKHYYDRLVGKI